MKMSLIILAFVLLVSSCKSIWNEKEEGMFYKFCIEDANKWSGSVEKSHSYCDCIISKIKKKYPKEEDVINNIDSIVKDPEIIKCKAAVRF